MDGYGTEDGRPVTEIENWRDILPISHREAAADLLFACAPDPKASSPVLIGAESVTLQSSWTQDDAGKGVLVAYSGLRHIFRVPSVEQSRRYSRDQSRSVITGGRKGTTQYPGAQRTLVQLYDELIKSVEGYTADGEPLNNCTDLIIRTMDTYHKTQAMGTVFAPAMDAFEEAEP